MLLFLFFFPSVYYLVQDDEFLEMYLFLCLEGKSLARSRGLLRESNLRFLSDWQETRGRLGTHLHKVGGYEEKCLHSGAIADTKYCRAVPKGYQDTRFSFIFFFFLRYSILHNISKLKIAPRRRRFMFLSPCSSLLLPSPHFLSGAQFLKAFYWDSQT